MSTLSANGETPVFFLSNPSVHVSGTFGGGTLQLMVAKNEPGASWHSLSDGVFTTPTEIQFSYERPVRIKGVLTGATSPNLTFDVF